MLEHSDYQYDAVTINSIKLLLTRHNSYPFDKVIIKWTQLLSV